MTLPHMIKGVMSVIPEYAKRVFRTSLRITIEFIRLKKE